MLLENGKTYRLTGWASWGITVYAGTVLLSSVVYYALQLATNGPHVNSGAIAVGASVLLTAAAAMSASQIRITIDDVGIQRVDGAGRALLLPWESISRLERVGQSQWNERYVLRSAHGTITFDRSWEDWEDLKQEVQKRAYRADRVW